MSGFSKIIEGKVKYLSREEEREHFRLWQEDGSKESHDLLFMSVLPLAIKWARDFSHLIHRPENYEIYECASAEGLLTAIDKFDLSKNRRLGTYAYYWSMNLMWKEHFLLHRVVNVPRYFYDRKYLEGISPRYKTLAENAQAKELSLSHRSLNGDLSVDIEDESFDLSKNAERQEELKHLLMAAVGRLEKRKRHIVVSHYFNGKSYTEIGNSLGITRQRVEQIHKMAIKEIKEFLNQMEERIC